MTAKSSPVQIRIAGQRVVLRTSGGEPEFAERVLGLVNARITDAEKRSGKSAAPHMVALLALLDLAEEYLRAKERTSEHLTQIDSKSQELIRLFEAGPNPGDA